MLTLDAGLAAHLAGDTTSLTVCYAIHKTNGHVIRGTAHDRDVLIPTGAFAGLYAARRAAFASDVRTSSDGSISNVELETVTRVDANLDDIKHADIEAGFFDKARAVLFMVNWASPASGQKVLLQGIVGPFHTDSDGRLRSEVRGRTQLLTQQIVRTFSPMCDVVTFGDSRCGLDIAPLTRTGTVTSVTNRKAFVATLNSADPPPTETYYNGGLLTFTSGDNATVIRETFTVSLDGNDATIVLWDEAPYDIAPGMTFTLPPACNRSPEHCKLHGNFVNFKGYGLFATGRDALLRGVN